LQNLILFEFCGGFRLICGAKLRRIFELTKFSDKKIQYFLKLFSHKNANSAYFRGYYLNIQPFQSSEENLRIFQFKPKIFVATSSPLNKTQPNLYNQSKKTVNLQ
jgi:hypothetical protein